MPVKAMVLSAPRERLALVERPDPVAAAGEIIVRDGNHWYSTGTDFKRPSPQWWYDDTNIYGPDGLSLPMALMLPGAVNRGNATQAVAAAVALGADPASAVGAVSGVDPHRFGPVAAPW